MTEQTLTALEPLLELVDIGVAILDQQGALIMGNSQARAIAHLMSAPTGYQPLASMRAYGVDGQELPMEERIIHKALTRGLATHSKVVGHPHPHRDGLFWLRSSALPILAQDGSVQGCVLTFNRTEPGQADQAQQPTAPLDHVSATETLFEAIIEAMSEGVVVVSDKGEVLRANPAACQTLGLTRDEMEGRYNLDPMFAFRDADGRKLDRHEIPSVRVISTGQPVRDQVLWVREGPHARCVSTNAVLLPPMDGMERRAVVTFTDITEAHRAQLELERSQDQFQGIVNSVPGIVFKLATFPTPHYRYLSKGSVEILGRPASDCPRPVEFGHLPKEQAASIQETLRKGEGQLDVKFSLSEPGEPVRWLQARARPRREGDQVYWNGVILDITESRRLEAQLRQSQRREALTEMVAGIAHNFNNALTAIIPNIQSALEGGRTEDLEDALTAAKGAQELVSQMLFIASQGPELNLEPMDLAKVVQQTVSVVRTSLPTQLALEVDCVPSAPVSGQASLLQQVLLTLVFNARDALVGHAAPRIRIRLSAGAEGRWSLRVEDNGPGLPESILENLGQPFLTTKPEGQGTGLGLATAMSIMRDHGGTLRVENSPTGASFVAELPGATPRIKAPRAPNQGNETEGFRILLVDDQPLVRRAIRRYLTRWGHQVTEAEGGLEALQLAKQTDLDLAVLDLSMPIMSGEELLGHLKERYPELPVVILTGYLEPEADLSQAQALLHKPPDMQELRELIGDLCG